MEKRKQTLEQERELLYQVEQQKNPTGNVNDNLNRNQAGMPNTTGMSTKEIGGLLLILFGILIIYCI